MTKKNQNKEAAHFLPVDHSKIIELSQKITTVEGRVDHLERRFKTQNERLVTRKELVQLRKETCKSMSAAAQELGLRDRDQLAEIVLRAFLEMFEEDHGGILFPLTLQQVETA